MERSMAKGPAAEDLADLSKRVSLLAEVFSRKMSDDLMELWIKALSPRYDEHTKRALEWACLQEWMPAPGVVMQRAATERHRSMMRIDQATREAAMRRAMEGENDPERERKANEFFAAMREKLGIEHDKD